jgi:hypothetical protein
MSPECQRKNLRPLEMVAVGVNKSSEQYMLLDERTKEDLASGRYHDQRRGTYGSAAPSAGAAPAGRDAAVEAGRSAPEAKRSASAVTGPGPAVTGPASAVTGAGPAVTEARPAAGRRPSSPPRRLERPPWTRSQQKLALLYNERGLRPDEIAAKIGLSRYLVTKIILTAKNGGKV